MGPCRQHPQEGRPRALRPSALGKGIALARKDVGKAKSKRKKNDRTRKVGKGLGRAVREVHPRPGGHRGAHAGASQGGTASHEEGALAPRREAGGPQKWRGGRGRRGRRAGWKAKEEGDENAVAAPRQDGGHRVRAWGVGRGRRARPAGKGLRKPGAPAGSRRPPSRRREAATRWYAPAPRPSGTPPTLWLRGEGCPHSVPAAANSWRHVGEGCG